jgi:2-aminoethylphosphonate-pyruvate transaminase
MGEICAKASIPHTILEFPENEPVQLDKLRKVLESSKESWGSVSVVHCETTSGVLNPITDIGKLIKWVCPNTLYIVDAMSSFGGVVGDFRDVDFLISSANKCLQGVPGFAFVVANTERLHQCKGIYIYVLFEPIPLKYEIDFYF